VQRLRLLFAVLILSPPFHLFAQQRLPKMPDEFFASPKKLCAALEGFGISTGAWEPIGLGPHPVTVSVPFECEYTGTPGSDDPGHASLPEFHVVYRVSGDIAARADIISIAVVVNKPAALASGQAELARLVAALFQFIEQPEPANLIAFMAKRRYYLSRRRYGVVWFNFIRPDRPFYQRTFWSRLSQ
jgi:hypothetical protein